MSIHHSRTAASGSGSAQPRSHPFSSVSFSPGDGGADAYAVASGKNLLHIFRLEHGKGIGGSRLEEIRSIRISQVRYFVLFSPPTLIVLSYHSFCRVSQHFQSPVQTTNSVSRGQNPQYPHLRDALRLPGAAPTVAPLPSPSTGGGGGININVTDVAWSLPQTYLVDDEVLPLANAGNTWPKRGDGIAVSGYEELVSPPDVHYTDPLPGSANEQNYHYPPFIQRHVIRDATTQLYDDSSVITAAGSNGVIVAWNANTLLSSSALTSSSSGVGSARGRSQQTSSITPLEQPEAAFLAHSRAVNRLAWHPTGRRPYLMLSASSDGTMKLWDRRATCSSSLHHGATGGAEYTATQNKLNQTTKSWFGFGNSLTVHSAHQLPTSAMLSTATWHCISTYQPKCEAVRDIRWNPVIDDLFAMVAGEWLLVYDIRIHKPMVKESTHAGDATSVDWHPSRRYVLATGGGRDRSVKGALHMTRYLNVGIHFDTILTTILSFLCSLGL